MTGFYDNQSQFQGNQNKFSGNINEDMTLTELFQSLGENQQYGWLYLRCLEREVFLYFQGDLVALASEPVEKLSFIPAKLYYAGKLPEGLYNSIMASENPLAELEDRVEYQEEVVNILNSICYEEICHTFSWIQGYFEFTAQNHPDAEQFQQPPIGKMFEIENILMSVAQRHQEMMEIAQTLPGYDEIVIQGRDLDMPCTIDDPMGNIWSLADYRSIKDILLLSYFSEFDASNILNSFLMDGTLRLISEEEAKIAAVRYEQEENYTKASEYYQLLLRRNCFDLSACESLAICYEKMGQINILGELYYNMSERFMACNTPQEQIQGGIYLKKFTELFPDSNEGIEARIKLFYFSFEKKIDQQYIDYNPIIEGKKLFQLLRFRKDDERAREILKRILVITPHDKTLQSQLINVCLDLRDIPSAVVQYENMAKIYKRDKNWEDLISTYNKIIKLMPSRKDIARELEIVQNKKEKGKRLLIRFLILLVLGGLVAGILILKQHLDEQKKLPPELTPEQIEELKRKKQEKIDRNAKKLLRLAQAKFKQKELISSKNLLESILKRKEKPSPEIVTYIQKELDFVLGKIKAKQDIFKRYKKRRFDAELMEKAKRYDDAIRIYREILQTVKFKNYKTLKTIRYPLIVKSDIACKVQIDEETFKKSAKVDLELRVNPKFKKIEIVVRGYKSLYFYNAFGIYGAKEQTFNKRKYTPLKKAIIEVPKIKVTEWTYELPGRFFVKNDVSYKDEKIYAPDRNSKIYTFELENDKIENANPWSHSGTNSASFTTVKKYRNVLYWGDRNYIYALNTSTNLLIGRTKITKGTSRKVALYSKGIIVGGDDGGVYALPYLQSRTRSWKPLWRYPRRKSIRKIISPPVVIGSNKVIVGGGDGFLYCLSLSRGGIYWKQKINRRAIYCEPKAVGRYIYIVENNVLLLLKVLNGRIMKKVPIQGNVKAMTAHKGKIYFGTSRRKIYCFTQKTLTLDWEFAGHAPFQASPLISKNILYIGSQRDFIDKRRIIKKAKFYALDITKGKEEWSYQMQHNLVSSPILIDNMIIQFADKVYAFYNN